MGFYDFPHTRNYDSDLGFLIKRYNELIAKVDTIDADILARANAYTDSQIANFNAMVDALRTELTNQYAAFVQSVNANIGIMNSRIDIFDDEIKNGLIGVNARTDLAIRQNNEYIKQYIASQLIDIYVINYFTGAKTTVQNMFDYLAQLHATNAIKYSELAEKNKTYSQFAAINMTYTQLAQNGALIIS